MKIDLLKRKSTWGIAVLVICVALSAVYFFNTRTTDQKNSAAKPLQAFFVVPLDGSSYPALTPIPVKAMVRGESALSRAELWADGQKVETRELDQATSSLIQWRYTPTTQGRHVLTVHLWDEDDREVVSEDRNLTITAPVIASALVAAQVGETPNAISARFGLEPGQVAEQNPTLPMDQPLTAGVRVAVPVILPGHNQSAASTATPTPAPSPTDSSGLLFGDGVVTLPTPLDGAYLYATADQQNWYRIPEAAGTMLIPQASRLFLPPELLPLSDLATPDSALTVEVWGWQAGQLLALGRVSETKSAAQPTSLQVCNSTYDCYGDMGGTYVSETSIADDDTDQMRKLWWYNPDPQVERAILQISLFPFAEGTVPSGVHEQILEDKGQFELDFAHLFGQKSATPFLPAAQVGFSVGQNGSSLQALSDLRALKGWEKVVSTVYLRAVPLRGNEIAGDPSAQVQVHQVPAQEGEDYEIYFPPPIYDVQIKGFTPIHFPEPGVCHGAMILDTDWTSPLSPEMVMFPAGTIMCPAPYRGVGEQSWYESLWDFVSSGVSWISEAYNSLKTSIVDVVGGLVCGGNEDCEAALAAGLDMGLVALGIPPSLPNFDQLMSEGLDYVAATLAEQAGCPDAACGDLIKQGLIEVLESTRNTNPACLDAAAAHNEGIEPLCLPEGVTAHPDPRALRTSATATVEVRRNSTQITEEWQNGYEMFKDKYLLLVRFYGFNAGPVGGKIINIPPYSESMTITEPLESMVFQIMGASIPPLREGESVILPFSLVATEYWVPGHKELMRGWTTVEYKDGWPQYYYDDWWKLYWGGLLQIEAQITACDPGWTGACYISEDSYGPIQLPTTAN